MSGRGQQVLPASRSELIEPFTGLSPRTFRRLVVKVEHRGGRQVADRVNGRQWSLPLADQVLLRPARSTAWTRS